MSAISTDSPIMDESVLRFQNAFIYTEQPKFKGNSNEDISQFIEEFKNWCNFKRFANENDKLFMLRQCLSDGAKNWADVQDRDISYENFIILLKAEYELSKLDVHKKKEELNKTD